MIFRGWQKTSLIEYPDQVATVLFVGGCNFRCPYCYNVDLVLRPGELTPIDGESVLSWLAQNQRLYTAVVVTGGEPTREPGLPAFCRRVKQLGLSMGLETNGSDPSLLARLLEQHLVDYVALDIKAPLDGEAYGRAAGVADPSPQVRRSVTLLGGSGIDYELRTTVVSRLHTSEDIRKLASQVAGAPRFALQRFRPGRCLDPDLAEALADGPLWEASALEELRQELESLFGNVEVRL